MEDNKLKEKNQNIVIASHFNLKLLKKNIGNDQNLLGDLLRQSKTYLDVVLVDLTSQWEIKNFKLIRKTAHRLRGASLTVCFQELANLSQQLELLDDTHLDKMHALIESIKIEINYLQTII